MSVKNLDAIFRPRSVAVVGASETPGRLGAIILKNLREAGFAGPIYPVNPKHDTVQGLPAYARISDAPQAPDLAVLCTPAATVHDLVDECGRIGVRGVIAIAAGFAEAGENGKRMQAELAEQVRRYRGMRLVGPNCLGVISPHSGLNASFANGTPKPGRVAFISQSGALGTAVLDWAIERGVGLAHFVSIGNTVDVHFGELIDYLGQDAQTQAIILYIEAIRNPRAFLSAARACSRIKPIIACKAGRTETGAGAVVSHTAAMAGSAEVYDAALRRAGVVTVNDIEQIFDCAELLSAHRPPRGQRLAILTNGGGPGVLAVDALIERRGVLAELAPATIDGLNKVLPPWWSHGNPVDVLGDAGPDRYAAAMKILAADTNVDAILVILTPQAMTDPTGTAEAIAKAGKAGGKSVLAAWMGGQSVRPGRRVLSEAGIPVYVDPGRAVDAFCQLVEYGRNLETLYETPRQVPAHLVMDEQAIQCEHERLRGTDGLLDESDAKALLKAYGIPVAAPMAAHSPTEAVRYARTLGYPVVLKVLSPQITHKTDVGGVVLDLNSDDEVRGSYEQLTATIAAARPDAHIDAIAVERMVQMADSHELILGAKRDPTFGMTMLVGMGGAAAEVLHDHAIGLPPLNEPLAMAMLKSLRIWPLLAGYRNQPGVDLDQLIEVMIRLSYLVAYCPSIREIEINPLLVGPSETIALDARAVVDRGEAVTSGRPFDHLAICPYPARYRRQVTLKNGTTVVLRAIRPEDEPMWTRMLSECSPESMHHRFFGVFKGPTHQMAARYCFIDYDRELAIVAELESEGERRLLGVGRLAAHPDHEWAEYAAIVVDAWQGLGLGKALTAFCVEIGREWRLKRVIGCTEPDNPRMIHTFQSAGFHTQPDGDMIHAELRY